MNDDTLTTVSGSDADVNLDSSETITVSSGDSVSSGDVVSDDSFSEVSALSDTVVPDGFYYSVVGGLWSITYLLSALLFFTIFKWVETKVRAIVRKVMWHE